MRIAAEICAQKQKAPLFPELRQPNYSNATNDCRRHAVV
jgi:hypothetical protein